MTVSRNIRLARWNRPTEPLTTRNIHWLVGLLEGEGHFGYTRNYHAKYQPDLPKIALRMTDRDVVERAAKIMGGYSVCSVEPSRTSRLVAYTFQVSGRRAAEWMMTLCGSMGIRRRGRIVGILTYWREYAPPKHTLTTCGHSERAHGRGMCHNCYQRWKVRCKAEAKRCAL